MSRLDSFIRRMSAQRDVIDHLADKLGDVPGPVFEFGFGSGRTYDHLRQRFPDRRIVVFEDVIVPAMPCLTAEDFVLGDLRETAATYPASSAALIHADIESGVAEEDAKLATWLPALVARLLGPGGYAASGAPLSDGRLVPYPLPPGIDAGRYYLVRRV